VQSKRGLSITRVKLTRDMLNEAKGIGSYLAPYSKRQHSEIQIIIVKHLLPGWQLPAPMLKATNTTCRRDRVRSQPS